MIIDCVVKLGSEEHIDLILDFLLNLLSVCVLLLDIEWLRPNKMRKKILIPDQAINLIADLTALGTAEVLPCGEEGTEVVIEGTIDWLVS